MQDQDVPPVEEGETGDGVDAVPRAAIRKAGPVATISAIVFTPHPWITATARLWPVATMDLVPAGTGLDLRRIIRRRSRSHCPCAKTQYRASLVSWTTCSSRPKFRKPHAS